MADGWNDEGSDWTDADWGEDDNLVAPVNSNSEEDDGYDAWNSIGDSDDGWNDTSQSDSSSSDDWNDTPQRGSSFSADAWSDAPSSSDSWGDTSSEDAWNDTPSSRSSSADSWGSTQQSRGTSNASEDWGSASNQRGTQDDSWDTAPQPKQNGNNASKGNNQQPIQFNFGHKTVGIICVVGFILLALILSFFSKIRLNKNTNQGSTQVSQTVQQDAQQQSQGQQAQGGSAVIDGSVLADNVNIDYSGSLQQASGVVQSLSRIVQDGQLLYCISISIPYNNGAITVRNYCTYSAYNSVQIGDMVNVQYQVVNGNIISVNEVTK